MVTDSIERGLHRMLSVLPGGSSLLERRRVARIARARAVFRRHYDLNGWGDVESVSGPGSTMRYTENIRKALPSLVAELGVGAILDAPCGDFNWFRTIEWATELNYVGGDIVEPLVARNQAVYGTESRRFIEIDIMNDPLPAADLWLCRDCLFHLSDRDAQLAIDNFLRSGIPYFLASTHPECKKNVAIPTGSFRLMNLRLPPFNLVEPMRTIDDWIEGFPVRHLALWHRDALRKG
jgi:hypothetical protein